MRKQGSSAKPKRKHGLSRIEKLLQDSIRHEIAIKQLWDELRKTSPMAGTNITYSPASCQYYRIL